MKNYWLFTAVSPPKLTTQHLSVCLLYTNTGPIVLIGMPQFLQFKRYAENSFNK